MVNLTRAAIGARPGVGPPEKDIEVGVREPLLLVGAPEELLESLLSLRYLKRFRQGL